jgi:hypothetical protein
VRGGGIGRRGDLGADEPPAGTGRQRDADHYQDDPSRAAAISALPDGRQRRRWCAGRRRRRAVHGCRHRPAACRTAARAVPRHCRRASSHLRRFVTQRRHHHRRSRLRRRDSAVPRTRCGFLRRRLSRADPRAPGCDMPRHGGDGDGGPRSICGFPRAHRRPAGPRHTALRLLRRTRTTHHHSGPRPDRDRPDFRRPPTRTSRCSGSPPRTPLFWGTTAIPLYAYDANGQVIGS